MLQQTKRSGRLGAAVSVGAGAMTTALALSADALGVGGGAGLGTRQQLLAALGAALVVGGCWLWSDARRARARAWWDAAAVTPAIVFWPCVVLAAWFGALVGLLEVAQAAVRKYCFGVVIRQPLDFVWMAPLSHLILFAALGCAVGLLARALPRLVKPAVAVFVFAALACWSQSLVYAALAPIAVLVVTAGVAIQLARIEARREGGLSRTARRSLPWLLGAVAASAIAVPIYRSTAAPVPAGAAPGPAVETPNVLLIVLDTVRADHLGMLGYERATSPRIDCLAEDGVAFERAYTTSPWTLPSHGSMFTGRHPHELDASWLTPLEDGVPTLAEAFAARGYATAGFVGNLNYCLPEQGVARGFQHYEDFYVEPIVMASATALGRLLMKAISGRDDLVRNDAATVTDGFLGWLPERGDRPFFAFLNYFDAHAYYDPPPELEDRFGPRAPHLFDWSDRDWSDEEMQGFIDAYDACIASIDHHIGRLLDRLRDLDILKNTLVIVVADHGEQFGEHGLLDHANSLYLPLLHAPMVWSLPGRLPAGVRIQRPVSLRDLPATIAAVAELDARPSFPGHSLASLWSPDGSQQRVPISPIVASVRQGINRSPSVPISKGDMYTLIEGWSQLIVNGDGTLELYDLQADPAEEHDLVETSGGRELAARLGTALDRLIEQ